MTEIEALEKNKSMNTKVSKIGFWKVSDPYGEFSNWYICSFNYLGVDFISSEQALMWTKATLFNDSETADKILTTTNQKDIKQLGREVKNYRDDIWDNTRYIAMVAILYAKFSSDEHLKSKLLSTEDAEIYEASPYDRIWGIGSSNVDIINGNNLLGKALMQVREQLRKKPAKWVYRLEAKSPDMGLWYNSNNELVWNIGELPECKTKDLPMDYDPRYHKDGRNWFSSCSNKEDLTHWYSLKDANDLLEKGFVFTRYLATEYEEYELETTFIKETSLAREELDINELFLK